MCVCVCDFVSVYYKYQTFSVDFDTTHTCSCFFCRKGSLFFSFMLQLFLKMHRVYSFCNFILFMEFSVVKDVSTWRMSSNWHSWKSDSFSFFIFFISFFLRNSSFSLACLFAWWIIDAYVSVAEEKNTNLCIFQRKKNSSRTSVNWWSS